MNIKANNLQLSYGNESALQDINFEVNEPKIYGLLGRNGAGKTSLLSLLGSFREPTAGQLLVNGEEPFENAKIMQMITFLYSKDFSDESETVEVMIKGMSWYRPNFDLAYAKELVRKFKLDEKKPINKLSKGKQSAFNVVIGLASRSPITIFDEVYLGMDAPARDIFYKELLKDQELHPRIIILSTHLVSEMDYLFDDVIIIKDQKILLHQSYDELVSQGAKIIGNKDAVHAFVKDKTILHEEELGDTKSITIYGELNPSDKDIADQMGLNITSASLHDLFIQLTKEEE